MKFNIGLSRISALLLSGFFMTTLSANPEGLDVIEGDVTVSVSDNVLDIQATDGAIITFEDFSNSEGELINITLPSSSGQLFIGVDSEQQSEILGDINSNARVYLINENGIIIGCDSTITTSEIFLEGGKVELDGLIEAYNEQGQGGAVTITGTVVVLTEQSVIDVSGLNSGGFVNVGGGFQGQDPIVDNAHVTLIEKGALIIADSIQEGNGGQVIVWSEEATIFQGDISARGVGEGSGGNVEIASNSVLEFDGAVDNNSDNGPAGTFIADQADFVIESNQNTDVTALKDEFPIMDSDKAYGSVEDAFPNIETDTIYSSVEDAFPNIETDTIYNLKGTMMASVEDAFPNIETDTIYSSVEDAFPNIETDTIYNLKGTMMASVEDAFPNIETDTIYSSVEDAFPNIETDTIYS